MTLFSFDSVDFERVHAHGGRRPVLFCRAREGTPTSAHNFVDLTIVPAGADIGSHTHALDNEETYVVVSGAGLMEADGHTFEVTPGTVVVNPPGGRHALVNPGPEDLRLVVIELKVPSP